MGRRRGRAPGGRGRARARARAGPQQGGRAAPRALRLSRCAPPPPRTKKDTFTDKPSLSPSLDNLRFFRGANCRGPYRSRSRLNPPPRAHAPPAGPRAPASQSRVRSRVRPVPRVTPHSPPRLAGQSGWFFPRRPRSCSRSSRSSPRAVPRRARAVPRRAPPLRFEAPASARSRATAAPPQSRSRLAPRPRPRHAPGGTRAVRGGSGKRACNGEGCAPAPRRAGRGQAPAAACQCHRVEELQAEVAILREQVDPEPHIFINCFR